MGASDVAVGFIRDGDRLDLPIASCGSCVHCGILSARPSRVRACYSPPEVKKRCTAAQSVKAVLGRALVSW